MELIIIGVVFVTFMVLCEVRERRRKAKKLPEPASAIADALEFDRVRRVQDDQRGLLGQFETRIKLLESSAGDADRRIKTLEKHLLFPLLLKRAKPSKKPKRKPK